MKFLVAFMLAGLPALAQGRAELSQVTSVYLLPMSNGLDQYLANRLTTLGVFQVVTDPQKADAVFTDQLGEGFEKRFEVLYPPPPPPETEKAEDEEEEPVKKPAEQKFTPRSTLGRGQGNLFLVNRKTRNVIWAIYERPKTFAPNDLDQTADRIVKRLKKNLSGK